MKNKRHRHKMTTSHEWVYFQEIQVTVLRCQTLGKHPNFQYAYLFWLLWRTFPFLSLFFTGSNHPELPAHLLVSINKYYVSITYKKIDTKWKMRLLRARFVETHFMDIISHIFKMGGQNSWYSRFRMWILTMVSLKNALLLSIYWYFQVNENK